MVLLALLAPAQAIEISLEENKAQRGNIGFVDMQKIFRLYPETHKAKQTYKKIVRQAEDQVNLRRRDIIRVRAELAQLSLERDLLEKAAVTVPTPSTPTAVEVSTSPDSVEVSTPSESVEVSTPSESVEVSTPSESVAVSTLTSEHIETGAENASETFTGLPGMTDVARKSDRSAAINIPGLDDPQSPQDASPPEPPALSPDAAEMMMRENLLEELDNKIRAKQAEADSLEAAFLTYQATVEKNLIEIETRRTEILLGKIYKAVRAVARESSVSIVVDKNQILFGQNAVDLTAKVLEKLKGLSL